MYTDTTLTREMVVSKIKKCQFDTIPKWNWDLTCQKKGFSKISRQKPTRIIHLPVSLLHEKLRYVKLTQSPSETGISPVKKKRPVRNSRLKCTRIIHLPVSWLSSSQSRVNLVQFPSDSGIWPVEKKDSAKFRGKSVHGSYTHQWVGYCKAKVSSIEYNSRVMQEFPLSKKMTK